MSFSAMPFDFPAMGGQGNLPPNVSIGYGPAPIDGGIAGQTQQQANNPIYGQSSPFQPPPPVGMMQNFTGGGHTGDTGMRPGVEKGFGMPPNRLQDIAQPGYDDPGFSSGGFGKAMGVLPFLPGPMGQAGAQFLGGVGQLAGGPAGQPILGGTPMQGRGQLAGGPAGQPIIGGNTPQPVPMMQGFPEPGMPPKTRLQDIARPGYDDPGFQGGLKPAPRNYRPPMRSGGILRQRLR